MARHLWACCALALLTGLGFFTIPGHTYLQSDTQIYLPILERLRDSTLFRNEIVTHGQHVSFTMYDEIALALRAATGASFESVLVWQQLLFRFAALVGAYLLAVRAGLEPMAAVFVAACFGLGATILGPSVLTFEYEPVPRGNAVGLVILATGLAAHGRYVWAGSAAALACLYQVPAAYPWCVAFVALLAVPDLRRDRARALLPLAAGAVLLWLFAQAQAGERESQRFFSTIDAEQEQWMRERASYNWVSLWATRVFFHHAFYLAAAVAAFWSLRHKQRHDGTLLLAGMMAVGVASLPVSYLLLEVAKWSLIPQIQPMRALLYISAGAALLCAIAGVECARAGRWLAAFAFFAVVMSLPARVSPAQIYADLFASWPVQRTVVVVLALAGVAVLACWRRSRGYALVAAAVLPYIAIPVLAQVKNYPPLHHAELDQLAAWARSSTAKDAVFLFPDAGRGLEPGVFRAQALRSVYVDWKGGGQINYLRRYLDLWLPRWQQMEPPFASGMDLERYGGRGIAFVVLGANQTVRGATSVYQNTRYRVYEMPPEFEK